MGNLCQTCLKQQVKRDKSFIMELKNEPTLISNQNVHRTDQIMFSNTMLNIESNSISDLDVETLIIFVDKPEAVLSNVFIRKLGISVTTILADKITKACESDLRGKSFRLKIMDPFYGVNIKRLIISQIKVWDGINHHDRYLKNIIQNEIVSLTRNGSKTSIGIMEIQSNLGYNLKDFYKVLMRKLKQYTQKFNYIAYVTHKRAQIEKFLEQDYPAITETQSVLSQSSNYY